MKYAAVLYTRVSTEEQSLNGVSLKDQEEKLSILSGKKESARQSL